MLRARAGALCPMCDFSTDVCSCPTLGPSVSVRASDRARRAGWPGRGPPPSALHLIASTRHHHLTHRSDCIVLWHGPVRQQRTLSPAAASGAQYLHAGDGSRDSVR